MPLLAVYARRELPHRARAARPTIPAILELVLEGRLRPELVTSRVVDWEEAPEAVREPERKLVIERS